MSLNLKNLSNNSFILVDEIFNNFSLIAHKKSLNIHDDKEEDFDNNINFYMLYLLLGENAVYKI